MTLFECGPDMCKHDYCLEEDLFDEDGRKTGSSMKCGHCGMLAIDEDMWKF